MKLVKRIAFIMLILAMLITSSVYAAPKYIIVDNKAYDILGASDEAYRNAMLEAINNATSVYIADDEGKTVSLLDMTADGEYSEKLAAAPNVADELVGKVKIIKEDLSEGDIIEIPGGQVKPEELKVESASAINNTTIKVVFSEEVPAEVAVKANFTVSKGTLESANKTGEKEVLLTVAGLNYEDVLTVTVVDPAYTQEVSVPSVDQLFKLVIKTDAEDDTIKSDGADMTMLTASIIEKATDEIIKRDAQIQFTTTLGSLSQPQVALQNGEASTQLRSISSPTSVTAVVTAVVASAPGAEHYVGLSGQKIVKFTPTGVAEGSVEMVAAVEAGADQGDRFFVTFSGDITAKAYKAGVDKLAVGPIKNGMGVRYVDGAGIRRDIVVKDVYNIRPDTLMFVLETDSDTPLSAVPVSNMIDRNYASALAPNYLRDNVNHKIIFPNNVPGVVVGSDVITFMMSDVTKPFVYGVDAEDNMTIKVRFSEAIAEDIAEGADFGINPYFKIDGKELRLFEAAAPSVTQINNAKLNNEIIVTQLNVGTYTSSDNDKRNEVDIKIHKEFKLATGTHGIQIANVGDWAGMTDKPQNIVTTQTFNFDVLADTGIPAVEVIRQSPEQFLITFNKPVDTVTGKTAEDAIKIYTKEGYAADPKQEMEHFANSSGGDYIITEVDEDGMSLGSIAPTSGLSEVTRLLVEFNRDWSVKLIGNADTKDNYWKSDISPLSFEFDHIESLTGLKMSKTTKTLANPYDGVSPTIVGAEDLYEKIPDKAFRSITALQNNTSGQFVFVEMSEPVQLVEDRGGTVTAITNPVTPNLAQDPTLVATDYNELTGLPVQTYRFIKDDNQDKVVYGDARDVAEDDITFVIEPRTNLESGWWTLYIEQISDDHGNTSATVSTRVFVPESEIIVSDTRIAWAAFDNDDDTVISPTKSYDYIYVKFTKVMKVYTADGVDTTMNYKFRGYDLPHGSEIFRGIDGITDDWDGVTIRMPKDAWEGINDGRDDFTTNMAVASNFKSEDGEKLSGPFQFELTDTATTDPFDDKDGISAADLFEAVYINNPDSESILSAAVIKAEAKDSDNDGDLDTIDLTFSSSVTLAGTEIILVGGKEFEAAGGTASTQSFIAKGGIDGTKVAANEIAGTSAKNLDVTLDGGAILINTGQVVDKAAPTITKAELNNDKDKITVTFSEEVTANNNYITNGFVKLATTTGFSFTGAGTATIDDIEHKESSANKVVLTVKNGDKITTASTLDVAAGILFDFTGKGVATPADGDGNPNIAIAFKPITGALAAGPAAPSTTFAFDGTNPNQLMGATTAMEYSLDGGTTWADATVDIDLTASLASITAANDIKVRVKATSTTAAGVTQTIDILAGPAAPSGYTASSDNSYTISGLTADTDYDVSLDSGSSWTVMITDNSGVLTFAQAESQVQLRVPATGTTLPGTATSDISVN